MSDTTQMTPRVKETTFADRVFIDAFRRGDLAGLINAAMQRHTKPDDTDDLQAMDKALQDMARFAMELRRQNVAVIGQHDAYVRHTSKGSLRQVIAPVKLSLSDDTLYQIPKSRKVGSRWEQYIEEPTKANVSYQGLLRINAVAGCAVGMPSVVIVDGEERTNPYREVGHRGDIARIVVSVNVVGPSPMTGNPVVVQYTLDLDPAKDLQHMLMQLVGWDNMTNDVFLVDEDEWAEHRKDLPLGDRMKWSWLRLYGSVGIAHNIREKEVRKKYGAFVNIMQNALKKALTVARRNAMKSHPALAFHSVRVDENGNATVRGVGWAADGGDLDRYAQLMERMARGLTTDLDDIEVQTIDETYEPDKHATGEDDIDADAVELDPETVERNALIQQIDQGIEMVTTAGLVALDYRPEEQTAEDLRSVLTAMNAQIDAQTADS